jgi:fumarate reductase flavoprotein subunit
MRLRDLAAADMPKRIIAAQNLDIDVVSGATEASRGILEAVADSVQRACIDPKAFHRGVAAALAAAQAGAMVIVLEKTDFPAGAGTMAGGMFAVGTEAQKAQGVPDASKWVYEQYMKASNYEASGPLDHRGVGAHRGLAQRERR